MKMYEPSDRRSAIDRRQVNIAIDFPDRRRSPDRRCGGDRRNNVLDEKYLRAVLNAFPSPVLIVDRNMQIRDANKAAENLLSPDSELQLRKLCGDLLHCIHAMESNGGCGTTEHCPDCALRQSVLLAETGGETYRRMTEMKREYGGKIERHWYLVSGSPFEYGDETQVIITIEDVTEITELRRIIPTCMHCKKVRDDNDYWQDVEKFLDKYTGVQFSHGICPTCLDKHYPHLKRRE